jgi:RecA/RadA recombinase
MATKILKKNHSTLMQKLLANSPTKNSAVMSESVFFNDRDVVPIDYPIFNIAFSGSLDGGMSNGLTVFAGVSGVYKTLAALICAKAYMNKYDDAICILLDSEGGVTPSYLKANGIDPSRVLHVPIEHLEMLKFELVKQLKEIERGDHVIFVIDSIGNTGSMAEIQNALDEKTVAEMQRAKTIKGVFRMITPSLVAKDIPCICIAHTYEEMGAMYARQIISGGSGIRYSANLAFIFSKAQEKDGKDLLGYNFTITVDKSRYVREKSKLTFQVLFSGGIQKYSGMLDMAIELGAVVKPSMGWYSRVNLDTGEIEDKKWRGKDTGCDEFWQSVLESTSFKKKVEERYKLTSASELSEAYEDLEEELASEE